MPESEGSEAPMNHHAQPVRQGRTVDELAALLEDALSAAAGWTVPPPDIVPLEGASGAPNWTVDTRRMDDGMRAAVRNLQSRYELKAPGGPGKRRFSFRSALAWQRGRYLLV
jgi:hypothetical protein